MQLVALNFYSGDSAVGEKGVLSLPERSEEFRANVPIVAGIGRVLGCHAFNAAYGNRSARWSPLEQDEVALRNLGYAAAVMAEFGGTVLLEPLSGAPDYPLRTSGDVVSVIDKLTAQTGASNVAFLCDIYHLSVNGEDVRELPRDVVSHISHVQIADAPGRGEPGSGVLPIADMLTGLERTGYSGWVSLEYMPTTGTHDSLRMMSSLP